MEVIGRLLYAGPEARRGTAGAMRHIGLCRRDVSARCRCRNEDAHELLQKLGYRPDEPMSVQDGAQVFLLWRTSPPPFVDKPASWAGADTPNFGVTPDSRI